MSRTCPRTLDHLPLLRTQAFSAAACLFLLIAPSLLLASDPPRPGAETGEREARALYNRGREYLINHHWKSALESFSRVDQEAFARSQQADDLLYRLTFNWALAQFAIATEGDEEPIEGRAKGVALRERQREVERAQQLFARASEYACKLPRNGGCGKSPLAAEWSAWTESEKLRLSSLQREQQRSVLMPIQALAQMQRQAELLNRWLPTLMRARSEDPEDVEGFSKALQGKRGEFSRLWQSIFLNVATFPTEVEEDKRHQKRVETLLEATQRDWERWIDAIIDGDYLEARSLGQLVTVDLSTLIHFFTGSDIVEISLDQRKCLAELLNAAHSPPLERETLLASYSEASGRSALWLKELAEELDGLNSAHTRSLSYALNHLVNRLNPVYRAQESALEGGESLVTYRLLINELGTVLSELAERARRGEEVRLLRMDAEKLRTLLTRDIALDPAVVVRQEQSDRVLQALNSWVELKGDGEFVRALSSADSLRSRDNRLRWLLAKMAVELALLSGTAQPSEGEISAFRAERSRLQTELDQFDEPSSFFPLFLELALEATDKSNASVWEYENGFFWCWMALQEFIAPAESAPIPLLKRIIDLQAHAIDALANAPLSEAKSESLIAQSLLETLDRKFVPTALQAQQREFKDPEQRQCRAVNWEQAMREFYTASALQLRALELLKSEESTLRPIGKLQGEAYSGYLKAYRALRSDGEEKELENWNQERKRWAEQTLQQLDIIQRAPSKPLRSQKQREKQPW